MDKPKRTITNNRIISDMQPRICIEIDRSLHYIGTLKFILQEIADVEVMIFLESDDNQKIQRLFMVQFEFFLDSANEPHHRYNYNTPTKLILADTIYQTDTRVVPAHLFAGEDDSDRNHVDEFIKSKGYQLPYIEGEQLVTQRIMRPLPPDNRAEIILIYKELLSPSDLFYTKPENTYLVSENDRPLLQNFHERVLNSVAISEDF